MAKARIVIGANYGDEGKGTVVAHYTKNSDNVLNILTNGGAQRAHSILTDDGNITSQHFGSGTYYGADNYYSRFFILNPMQFVREYESLIVKPKTIYRDSRCIWTTPYDSIANLISEELQKRQASCCMGIWNTIRRSKTVSFPFNYFINLPGDAQTAYLLNVKTFYEREMTIPDNYKDIWDSPVLREHFIRDCNFLYSNTVLSDKLPEGYDNLIFENGQGLLLSDTGYDTPDTTPSDTGIRYSIELLEGSGIEDVTAHYVTRPYLTRHGYGNLNDETQRQLISSGVHSDRTNHYNDFQGDFRFGKLDINSLDKRIRKDAKDVTFEVDVTHCDEMDRVSDFNRFFGKVNIYDSAFVK